MGPHAALAQFAFSNVDHARGVLATSLPPAIAACIDFATLRLEPGTFVDEALRDRHADLLFAARIAGRDVLLYLVLEHEPEPLTRLQILRHMLRIWDQHLAGLAPEDRAPPRTIPVIVPIVLHHDPGGWKAYIWGERMVTASSIDDVLGPE